MNPQQLLAARLAGDFAAYVKQAWPVLQPTRPLVWSWHYGYLCEMLTLVKQRRLRRLVINIPPRTLKSTLVTIRTRHGCGSARPRTISSRRATPWI